MGRWRLKLGTRPPGFLPTLGTAFNWTSDFLPLLELPPSMGGKESPQGGQSKIGEKSGTSQSHGPVQ